MTPKQATGCVAMLAAVYDMPAWDQARLKVFAAMIEEFPYPAAIAAVKDWIRTSKDRPQPSQIRAAIRAQMDRVKLYSAQKLLPAPAEEQRRVADGLRELAERLTQKFTSEFAAKPAPPLRSVRVPGRSSET